MIRWFHPLRALGELEKWLSVLLIVGSIGIGIWAVLARDFWSYSWPPATGLMIMLAIWASLIGASRAVDSGVHVGLTVLVDLLPKRIRLAVDVFGAIVVLFFAGWVLYLSVDYERFLTRSGGTSYFTSLPTWAEFIGVPVAFGLMTVHCIHQVLRTIRDLRLPEAETPPEKEIVNEWL